MLAAGLILFVVGCGIGVDMAAALSSVGGLSERCVVDVVL